jgi:hypothetical protein
MAIEIERRFLVRDPQAAIAGSTIAHWFQIRQSYLGWVDGWRIRVRLIGDDRSQRSAVLALKGRRVVDRGLYTCRRLVCCFPAGELCYYPTLYEHPLNGEMRWLRPRSRSHARAAAARQPLPRVR